MAVIEVIEVGLTYLYDLTVGVEELHFEIKEVTLPHVVRRLLLKMCHNYGMWRPVRGGYVCVSVSGSGTGVSVLAHFCCMGTYMRAPDSCAMHQITKCTMPKY